MSKAKNQAKLIIADKNARGFKTTQRNYKRERISFHIHIYVFKYFIMQLVYDCVKNSATHIKKL